jgi:hypothetical protein
MDGVTIKRLTSVKGEGCMKKVLSVALLVLVTASFTQAQYKGKYEGWSTGYRFTGSLTTACYKAFTHICDFGTMVSGGTANGGSTSFVSGCHTNNCKAILCIGGQGNSSAFTSACGTQAGITKLVKSIMASVRAGGYDGADMDWEEGEESGFDGNATKVAMFGAFHKEMAESLHAAGKLATAAVVFDWYPKGSQAAGQWMDQANSMTYYDPVTSMLNFVGPNQIGAVPKTKVGVGFGWDTDNEITDPNDILAKCRWSIDNGYGGIMAWHITRATSITPWILDSIARYVTHNPPSAVTPMGRQFGSNSFLFVKNNRFTGLREISYTVSPACGSVVDLGMYDTKGALVKNLFHGRAEAGTFAVPSANSGAYVFKLSSGSGAVTTKAIIAR